MMRSPFDKIRRYVRKEARKDDYQYHIRRVEINAMMLAKQLGANLEVVRLAALLHDIGRLVQGTSEKHHLTGPPIAAKILRECGYPAQIIEPVYLCILNHRCEQSYIPNTLEEKIIAVADAMSHLESILTYYFGYPRGKFPESFYEARDLFFKDWNKLSILPLAQEIMQPYYDAVIILIIQTEDYLAANEKKR